MKDVPTATVAQVTETTVTRKSYPCREQILTRFSCVQLTRHPCSPPNASRIASNRDPGRPKPADFFSLIGEDWRGRPCRRVNAGGTDVPCDAGFIVSRTGSGPGVSAERMSRNRAENRAFENAQPIGGAAGDRFSLNAGPAAAGPGKRHGAILTGLSAVAFRSAPSGSDSGRMPLYRVTL